MFNIKISINLEILFFILWFIFSKQINLYLTFLLFILIHELSHMIVGISLGFKIKQFMVMPFGFKIAFKEPCTNKKNEKKKLLVIAAGPVINIFTMIVSIILKWNTNIIYVNMVLSIFNLLPIYPLDGGRLIKSVLNIKLGYYKAYKIINKVSNLTVIFLTAVCSIYILYIKNISIIIVLTYLWYVVLRENKSYKLVKRVYDALENN